MPHLLSDRLNLLITREHDSEDVVVLSTTLMGELSDKVHRSLTDGTYRILSPLTFHHLVGTPYLRVRVVSEEHCWKTYYSNLEQLRQATSPLQSNLFDEDGITPCPSMQTLH